MMSFIARVPSNVSSSTSVSPGKRRYGNQDPWSTNAEKEEIPGRPVVGSDRKTASDYYHEQFIESSSSASYSKWDDNHAWSSQECKTDTEMCERSGKPDVDPQRGTRPQQFIIGNDETEVELSVESRSFVNRVNDQVRKRQKRISNVTEDGEKHSVFWGMFMTVNNGITSIHGKELPDQLSIHREHDRSHTQTNVRHIYKIGVWARWDLWIGNNCLGKSLLAMKELSIFNAQRSTSFQILYCVLVRFSKTPNRTMHENKDWDG